MKKPTVCVSCGKTYDRDAFGAGFKYCTKQCRYTKNGTVSMERRYRGRSRRFPRVSAKELEGILAQLRMLGFKVTKKLPVKTPIPRIFNVQVGLQTIPVSIGAKMPDANRSHVALYEEGGVLKFKSTCSRTRNYIHVADGLKTRCILRLSPCHHHECRRCVNTQLLRETFRNVEKKHEAH